MIILQIVSRLIAVVKPKKGMIRVDLYYILVGKFGRLLVFTPIILFKIEKYSKVCFHDTIVYLSLTMILRMDDKSEPLLDSKNIVYGRSEL